MCDSVQNRCRICLDIESDHVSIIGDPTINLQMKSCLAMSISTNDQLPKTICVACVSQLSQFYSFQLHARCSQDWLESSLQVKKKTLETKTPLQPLPDSEYNSDSLLEFLNSTANIEEYLNNLGKEDIPSIVNMLDRNEQNIDIIRNNCTKVKIPSPKKKDSVLKHKNKIKMETDSDFEITKGIAKGTDSKQPSDTLNKNLHTCFGCKMKFESLQNLSQHISICDSALRTCIHCNTLFDSKQKMQEHSFTYHAPTSLTCSCGENFYVKDKLMQHQKTCHADYGIAIGCIYRCKQCGCTFKDRFQLYKHAKEHIMKAEERVCDICGHTFIGSDSLMKHKREEHENNNNLMYRCKICNLTSQDRKEIYIHVQNHTVKMEPNRHLCEACGRSFATRATLMRHSLQHGVKYIKCNICEKRFTDIRTRDEHVTEHIEVTMCERCGQTVNCFKLDVHTCI